MGLRAFHFSYMGTTPAETYRFYRKFIRGFHAFDDDHVLRDAEIMLVQKKKQKKEKKAKK